MDVAKYGQTVPISAEAIRDGERFRAEMARWESLTPEQRRAESEAAAAAGRAHRAGIRAAIPAVPVTAETLAAKNDWSREYAEHYVQPYCECDYDSDGAWNVCEHARDLGLRVDES
jgi:hypothetical protein